MRKIFASFVIFGICVSLFLSQNPREYADFKIAESTQNFAPSTQEANSSIFDESQRVASVAKQKSGLRSHERGNRTNGSLTKRVASLPDLSHPTGCKVLAEAKKDAEFAYLPNAENSAHSSSLTDFGNRLLVAYFAGSREGASDVKIMAHFVDKSTLHSTLPREILSAQCLSNLTGKFIKKLGNPLIFKSANGGLHFFVVGVSLGGWATSKIYHLQLSDDLETLTLRNELRLGLLGNFSHLIRTPPLMLENGGFMLPLYHELARKYPLVAFFDENGDFSHALRLNHLKNQLQPTIIALNERECLAFFRNHKAHNNASFLQKCSQGGGFWESPSATNLKGFDDSYLLLRYKNAEGKSRILLLYNDGKLAESGNSRRSLGLYYLADSTSYILDSTTSKHEVNSSIADEFLGFCEASDADKTNGLSRKRAEAIPKKSLRDAEFIFLKNIDIVDEAYPNEVSYPSAVIDESALFVGYTYNRKAIKLQKINLADIERKIVESTTFCHSERSEESQKNIQNRDSSVASLSQNDKIMNFAESSAESTTNYDIFGIYLLFLSAFFFATKSLSNRARFCALPCFVALISIPFIFVLWDYYSIVKLFYSLFGGTSVFCALLCVKYILQKMQNLQGGLPRKYFVFARNDNVKNLALLIALFSIPLFLGHLDLISVDILRSGIFSAIFASAFIVALFWADIVAFVLALVAVIIDKDFIFALFDGYLLIFSVVYCAIWAIKLAFKKIIARA